MSHVFEDTLTEVTALYAWLPSREDEAYLLSDISLNVHCPGTDVVYDTASGAGVTIKFVIVNKVDFQKSKWWKPWTWFSGHGTAKHDKAVNERASDIADRLTKGRDICVYVGNVAKKKQELLFCGVITNVSQLLTTATSTGMTATVEVDASFRDAIVSQGTKLPTFKIDGSYGEVKIKQSVEAPKKVESDIIDKEIDGAMGNYALNVSAITATILDGTNKPEKYVDGSGSCAIRNLIDVDEDDLNARIEIDDPSQGKELGSYLAAYIADNCANLTPYTAFIATMQHFYIVAVPRFSSGDDDDDDYEYSPDRRDYKLRPGCMWGKWDPLDAIFFEKMCYTLDTDAVVGYELSNATSHNASSYFSVAVRYASPRKSDASDNVENFAMYTGGYDDGKPWMLAGNEVRKKWFEDKYELKTGYFHFNKDLTNLKVYELPAWVRFTEAWGSSDDMAGVGTADPPEVYANQKKWADCIAKQLMASLVRTGSTLYINVRYETGMTLRKHMGKLIKVELPQKVSMSLKTSKMFTQTQTWYGYLSSLNMRINTLGHGVQVLTQITLSAARPERDQKVFSVPVTDLYDID